jgi:hypothetical protein
MSMPQLLQVGALDVIVRALKLARVCAAVSAGGV